LKELIITMSTTTETTRRSDSYSRITNHIIAELEKGVRPWHKPWKEAAGRISRPLRHNGESYSGINVVTLWMDAEFRGFRSPFWMTFNQAKDLGGFVKKGEHGAPVVYASRFTKKETDESGEEVERNIPFMKEYVVFNADQIKGLPLYFYELSEAVQGLPAKRIEQAEQFFANTKADIRVGGSRAFYTPVADFIQMPRFESFDDGESHAATLAHELTHWTSHASRLAREFGSKRWGDDGYAIEELVAELAAAFLCADLAITPEVRDDHASYIGNWLTRLKSDKRAIFTAASHASKAVEYLHSLQPKPAK
jgi:antirestriction protein ArdC